MKVLLLAPLGDFKVSDGGYGNASNGILNVLMGMQRDQSIEKVDFINTSAAFDNNMMKEDNYDLALFNVHPNSFLNPQIFLHMSNLVHNIPKRYLHVVWETTPLPRKWNFIWGSDLFNGFFTPSHFVENMIKDCTQKPVYFLPHYIDVDLYDKVDAKKKMEETIFSVLFVGQHTKRKGLEEALISFTRALGDKKDTQLILKWHPLTNSELPVDMLINYHIRTNCPVWNSGIYTLTDKLLQTDMINLYKGSSLLLMPTRGEGFGLPLIEASSVGIPVIYTNWSSCPEVMEGTLGNNPVDYMIDSSVNMTHCGYEIDSFYAVPKISSIKTALRQKYDLWKLDKEEYYKNVDVNRKIMEEKYGYEAIKNHLLNIMKGE